MTTKTNKRGRHTLSPVFETPNGQLFNCTIESFLDSSRVEALKGKVNLILTSPPFPLKTKKKYGNLTGDQYLLWLAELAAQLASLLSEDGSIVLEIGNCWESGKPFMSTLPLRSLLTFLDSSGLNLCQQFVCHNPARLPSPAQWVTIKRTRVKDTFTNIWWMAKGNAESASNLNVLEEYSASMKKLLKSQKYNAGKRPSEHNISASGFLKDHGGAIPPNVLIEPENLLAYSNTSSATPYLEYCRNNNLTPHPARMQPSLAEFMIKLITGEGDLVFDPFAGSNTTGAVAESLRRKWVSIEADQEYAVGAAGWFDSIALTR